MPRPRCLCGDCRQCRERLRAAGLLAPKTAGVKPTCECGKCRKCKVRKWRRDYYYRYNGGKAPSRSEPSDLDLDRIALQGWRPEWGVRRESNV